MSQAFSDLPEPFPSVFDRLTPADIRLDPFPHIVKEDALDAALCARLIATRISYETLAGAAGSQGSNRRLAYNAAAMLTPDFIDASWKAMARIHTRREVTLRVAELFAEVWPEHLPSLEWLREASWGMFGHDLQSSAEVLCDARLELIGPSNGPPWSHRAGHVDTANRLFSALYYLRAPDDDTTGGGLDLFRYRGNRPSNLNVFEFEDEQIEKVTTVAYKANTLVVFPNSPLAIHGSEPRGPSARDRAYVFITAEVERDLFS